MVQAGAMKEAFPVAPEHVQLDRRGDVPPRLITLMRGTGIAPRITQSLRGPVRKTQ